MEIQIASILPADPIDRWELPQVYDAPLYEPLTNLLRELSDFQQALLPRSRAALTTLNRAIRDAAKAPPQRKWPPAQAGEIGLAVDRGALFLAGCDIVSEVRYALDGMSDPRAGVISSALRSFSPSSADNLDQSVVGWLFVLGRLDSICRGVRPLDDINVGDLPARAGPKESREWFASVVSADVAEDIHSLLLVVKQLQPSGEMYPNPQFGALGPIRASDGDWIVGDTLIELKCTSQPVKREYVAQLICYAAL